MLSNNLTTKIHYHMQKWSIFPKNLVFSYGRDWNTIFWRSLKLDIFFWKFNAEKLFDHQTTSKPVETGFFPKLNLKGREDMKNSRHSVVSYTTFSGVILTSNIHTKNIRLNSRCNKEGVRRKNSSKIVKSQSKFPIRIIFWTFRNSWTTEILETFPLTITRNTAQILWFCGL